MRAVLAVLICLVAAAPALAADRWVATDGHGTACTQSSPCPLSEAVQQVDTSPADGSYAIHVAAGNYPDPPVFTGGAVTLDGVAGSTSIGRIDVRSEVAVRGVGVGGGAVAPGARLTASNSGFYGTLHAAAGSSVTLSDDLLGANPAVAGSGSVVISRGNFPLFTGTEAGPVISAADLVLRQSMVGSYDRPTIDVSGHAELTDVVISGGRDGAVRIGGALTARFLTLVAAGGLVLGDGATAAVRDSILHAPIQLGADSYLTCTTTDIAPIDGCTADGGNTDTPDATLFAYEGAPYLGKTSPAIDTADPAPDPYDADGDAGLNPRRVTGHCTGPALPDRGAIEYQGGLQRTIAISPMLAPQVGESVQFSFLESPTRSQNVLWDFGDGSTSSLPDPTHAFDRSGVYTITLTDHTHGEECRIPTTTYRLGVSPQFTGSLPHSTGKGDPPDWEPVRGLKRYLKLPRAKSCRLKLVLRSHAGEAKRLKVRVGKRKPRSVGQAMLVRLHRRTRVAFTVTLRSGAQVTATKRFCV